MVWLIKTHYKTIDILITGIFCKFHQFLNHQEIKEFSWPFPQKCSQHSKHPRPSNNVSIRVKFRVPGTTKWQLRAYTFGREFQWHGLNQNRLAWGILPCRSTNFAALNRDVKLCEHGKTPNRSITDTSSSTKRLWDNYNYIIIISILLSRAQV